MKFPLMYPKIPNCAGFLPRNCVAFEKIDGTNMHWVWNRTIFDEHGSGWARFGTRRDTYFLVDNGQRDFWKEHKGLEGAFPAFWDTLNQRLEKKLESACHHEVICFTEYSGPNSFAGQHLPEDHKKHTIIDLQVDGKLLAPGAFLSLMEDFPIAKVVYTGKFSGQLVEDIRAGHFPVNEGVVLKGVAKGEVNGEIYMAKVKTLAYQEKLKSAFKDAWEGYWE